MRTIRVHFATGDTITTNINGTADEIREYYIGNVFNLGTDDPEILSRALSVEFIDTPEHMTQQRANQIYEQCLASAGNGPWSDRLRDVMTSDEIEAITQLWKTKPGHYSFSGTLLEIRNYNPAQEQ